MTLRPAGSRGTNGVFERVKLLYMARAGSDAFTDSAGTGGGVHSGIAAAMVAVVGRIESMDVAERNRILEDLGSRQMHPTERSSINNSRQMEGVDISQASGVFK